MAVFSALAGTLTFIFFVMILSFAISAQYKKKPSYYSFSNVYLKTKDLPDEVTFKAGWWKRLIIALSGRINLRTTKLVTEKVSFSLPTYSNGSKIPGYKGAYLIPQESPSNAFARIAYIELYSEGAMKVDTHTKFDGVSSLDYGADLDKVLTDFRSTLYRVNDGARLRKQISQKKAFESYDWALRNDSSLTSRTRQNRTSMWLLIVGLLALVASVLLRNPLLAIIPSLFVSVVVIACLDKSSEIWQWMFKTRKTYVLNEVGVSALLPVLSYRNYLEGLSGDGAPAYSKLTADEARTALVWSSVFGVEDAWFKNFNFS